MRTILFAILGFVLGLIILPVAVFFGYVAFAAITNYHDFEGATGMGVLSMMPVVGLIGGAVGAALFAWRAGRRRSA